MQESGSGGAAGQSWQSIRGLGGACRDDPDPRTRETRGEFGFFHMMLSKGPIEDLSWA